MAKIVHLFQCSCEGSKEQSFDDFKKHLTEVHNLNNEEMEGKKEMTMHIDGKKFFSSVYKWTLKSGLTFTEYYESGRSKKDYMYH